jgi:hypothetical protein
MNYLPEKSEKNKEGNISQYFFDVNDLKTCTMLKHELNGKGIAQGHGKIFHFGGSTCRKIAPKINAFPSLPQRIFPLGHSCILPIIIWAVLH